MTTPDDTTSPSYPDVYASVTVSGVDSTTVTYVTLYFGDVGGIV